MPTEEDMKRLRELADSEPAGGVFACGGPGGYKPRKTYRESVLSTWNDLNGAPALTNAALGLCGEAGELGDLVKKHVFHGHPLDMEKFIKELGDVRYYLEILAAWATIPMDEIERKNTEKLAKRYPNGFTKEASLNRVEYAKEEKKD